MRRRYIVLNPALSSGLSWIQGDIDSDSPYAAAARLEQVMSEPTPNDVWEVYVAPETFPAPGAFYSGGDDDLLSLLRSDAKPIIVPNRRVSDPNMAYAC